MTSPRALAVALLGLFILAPLAAHAGVGASPPYVTNSVLLPGSHYEQQISVSETGTSGDRWVHPVLATPEIEGWISYDPPPPFRIPEGSVSTTFRVLVDVPMDAALGTRTGRLYLKFNTSPTVVSGGGVACDVSLTVTDTPVVNLRVRRYYSVADTVSRQPLEVCMDVENSGNTAGTYDLLAGDIKTYGGALVASVETSALDLVPPFTRSRVCGRLPNPVTVGTASYYKATLRLFTGGVAANTWDTIFRFLPSPNHLPVAVAGDDQWHEVPSGGIASVTVDGSGSVDADSSAGTSDDIVAYAWLLDGQVVADTAVATLDVAPGAYLFTLQVTDSYGESDSDDVLVTVLDNIPPTAAAGPAQTVRAGADDLARVVLDGSGSTDPDSTPGTHDDIVAFDWLLDGAEVASGATAPLALPPGEHVFTLVVTDSFGASDSDDVVITVLFDAPPVAVAGPSQWLIVGDDGLATAGLDGAASSDPDSTPGTSDDLVAYDWFIGGAPVASGASAALTLGLGEYVVTLVVTDRQGKTASDAVTLLVTLPPNDPPVALAALNDTAEVDPSCVATVALDGTGSSDPNSSAGTADDIVDYAWFIGDTQVAGGAQASVALPPGHFEITLVVTDAAGEQAEDTAAVDVVDVTPPVIAVTIARDTLWPPTRELVDPGFTATVVDNCDAAPEVTLSVSSDEPSGTRTAAAVIDPDGVVTVRADRDGKSDGRVYVIGVSATDAAGNPAWAGQPVSVPHGQKTTAVDSGQDYDATVRE